MKKFILLPVVALVLAACNYGSTSSYAPSTAPAVATTTTSQANPSGNIYMSKTSAKGNYMTDFNGMTLYTYDKDSKGVSNCTGGCATIWMPYSSGATAQGTFPANVSVFSRADGSAQFAWMGKPLYYFSSDKAAGDMMGDGTGGVWHIVKL